MKFYLELSISYRNRQIWV